MFDSNQVQYEKSVSLFSFQQNSVHLIQKMSFFTWVLLFDVVDRWVFCECLIEIKLTMKVSVFV